MRLIQIFTDPRHVFRDWQGAGWFPAFLAAVALALISNFISVKAIGVDVIIQRSQADTRNWNADEVGPELAGVYAAKPFLMMFGILSISIILWLVCRVFGGVAAEGKNVGYVTVLVICSYAAYVREAVRLVVVSAVVLWHLKTPVTSALVIKTSAAAFLRGPVSSPVLFLARSFDILTFGFLGLVMLGLSRMVSDLQPQRAVAMTVLELVCLFGSRLCLEALRGSASGRGVRLDTAASFALPGLGTLQGQQDARP